MRRTAGLLPSRRINRPTIAAPSLVRSAGQHPPFASFGQIAPGQIRIAGQGIEPTAASAETDRTTTAARTDRTTTAAAAISIPSTPLVTTRVHIAPRLRPRHGVHHVVEIALLLGVGRRVLARQDAHQPYPGRALANHRERLHETRKAIAPDLHRFGHGLGLRPRAKVRRCRFDGWLSHGIAGRFAACIGRGRCSILRRRASVRRRLGHRFFWHVGGRSSLGRRLRGGGRLLLCLGIRRPKSLLRLCRLSQENPGEFGDCLHERVLRVMGAPSRKPE
jgi:hypothetical protein